MFTVVIGSSGNIDPSWEIGSSAQQFWMQRGLSLLMLMVPWTESSRRVLVLSCNLNVEQKNEVCRELIGMYDPSIPY